jgi:Phospholipase_D-nuclease N-terminal
VSSDTVIVLLVIGLPALLIWVWALVDAARNPELSTLARAVWLATVVVLPGVGALLYIAVPGRRRLSTH